MKEAPSADHHRIMKLSSVQLLRAIAVMMVVYGHSIDVQMAFATSFQQHFFHLLHFCGMGVDIFFVISGFIISWSAGKYRGIREGKRFLSNRFIRLIPLYWLTTLLFLGLQLHHMSKAGMGNLLSLPFIIKTVFLLPLADKSYFIMPLIIVAWTLSFEWLFYLLFVGMILFSTRRKVFCLSLLIVLLVMTGYLFRSVDYRLNFLTNPMLLEFLLGVLIYQCYISVKITRAIAWLLLLTGIMISGYEIITGYGDIFIPAKILDAQLAMSRFLIWGIPSNLLAAGCIFLEKNGELKFIMNNRLFALIGDASYSIYLTHLSVFGLLTAVYTRLGFLWNADLAVFVQFFAAITGGIFFYQWVEVPLLRKLRQSRKKLAAA